MLLALTMLETSFRNNRVVNNSKQNTHTKGHTIFTGGLLFFGFSYDSISVLTYGFVHSSTKVTAMARLARADVFDQARWRSYICVLGWFVVAFFLALIPLSCRIRNDDS